MIPFLFFLTAAAAPPQIFVESVVVDNCRVDSVGDGTIDPVGPSIPLVIAAVDQLPRLDRQVAPSMLVIEGETARVDVERGGTFSLTLSATVTGREITLDLDAARGDGSGRTISNLARRGLVVPQEGVVTLPLPGACAGALVLSAQVVDSDRMARLVAARPAETGRHFDGLGHGARRKRAEAILRSSHATRALLEASAPGS